MNPSHNTRGTIFRRLLAALFAVSWLPLALTLDSLVARTIPPPTSQWRYTDLRILDPIDEAILPQCDFIAAYIRTYRADLEIRLDFLNSQRQTDCDVYLAMDWRPGGSFTLPIQATSPRAWDALLVIRADQKPVVRLPSEELAPLKPLLLRDPSQDTWTIRLNRYLLHEPRRQLTLMVWSTLPGQNQVADAVGPFDLSSPPPPPAPVALVFWDALPAATPAQALRRWDGAHTGPFGQRHGLRHLIEAASTYQIPVILTDLLHPTSLSGLDAVGGLKVVQRAFRRGTLILPTPAIGAPPLTPWTHSLAQDIRAQFDLDASIINFGAFPVTNLHPGQTYFFRSKDTSHIFQINQTRLIPLPTGFLSSQPVEPQIESTGDLTLSVKRALIDTALSPDKTDIVILGESLPGSPWGDRSKVFGAMAYLANHPWIRILDENDLQTWPTQKVTLTTVLPCSDLWCTEHSPVPLTPLDAGWQGQLNAAIATLEQTPVTSRTEALHTGLILTAALLSQPTANPALQALRIQYQGELAYIREALLWASHPDYLETCSRDLDSDGRPECLLSTSTAFAVITPQDGRLAHLSLMHSEHVIPVVASSAQLALGLSDPSLWNPKNGLWADPNVIPGEVISPPLETPYQVSALGSSCLTLTNPQNRVEKRYCLHPGGLTLELRGTLSNRNLWLPLIVSPEQRLIPRWTQRYYLSRIAPNHAVWAVLGQGFVEIKTSQGDIEVTSFTDALPWLGLPEDPNRDYPAGHYLPFPMALFAIKDPTNLLLEIILN
jgi:hypothetical protein